MLLDLGQLQGLYSAVVDARQSSKDPGLRSSISLSLVPHAQAVVFCLEFIRP
jgi:hypothetical protein